MTRPTGSPKYGTTRHNTQPYYTTKRLVRYLYSIPRACETIECVTKKTVKDQQIWIAEIECNPDVYSRCVCYYVLHKPPTCFTPHNDSLACAVCEQKAMIMKTVWIQGVLYKVLYGEAPPQGLTHYDLFVYHFDRKGTHFRVALLYRLL